MRSRDNLPRNGHCRIMRDVFRPSNTTPARAELGWHKSDANDARLIYDIALQKVKHVYPVPTPFPEWAARRAELNAQYLLIRGRGEKGDLAKLSITELCPFAELPADFQTVLGRQGLLGDGHGSPGLRRAALCHS